MRHFDIGIGGSCELESGTEFPLNISGVKDRPMIVVATVVNGIFFKWVVSHKTAYRLGKLSRSTLFEGTDAGPMPFAFFAFTVNV